MLLFALAFFLTAVFFASGAQPEVKCPAPVSPVNGKALLTQLGTSVKYSCNPEFILKGSEIAICKEDQWLPEAPTCEPAKSAETQIIDMDEVEPEMPPSVSVDVEEIEPEMPPSGSMNMDDIEPEMPLSGSMDMDDIESEMPSSTPRLFKWDNEEQEEINSSEKSEVDDDMMLSDEARVRRVIYPRRRKVTTAPIKVRSAGNLEKEERKRSSAKSDKEEVSPPSVVYVRRQASPAKSWSYPYRHPYQVVANTDEENGRAHHEALRYYYWASQHPRSASFDYYHRSGLPLGLQLSESQMAWINGLQPELRDRYLKDLYGVRANGVNYLTYPDTYPWLSANAHYTRLPLAGVAAIDPSVFDYSCYRTERNGRVVQIHAPKLLNAVVRRYDKRQNRNHPRNDYLAAEYQCKTGYRLLDSRSSELYCSKGAWIGNLPVCVPKI